MLSRRSSSTVIVAARLAIESSACETLASPPRSAMWAVEDVVEPARPSLAQDGLLVIRNASPTGGVQAGIKLGTGR